MNCTDQVGATPEARLDESTVAVLRAIGEHFRTVNPTDVLENTKLLVCVGAEAYNLVDRRLDGDAPGLARTAMAAMPELREGITRGEYVLHIRDAVLAAGHDWPDGDNDPAIPRITGIPGPRTEPTPGKRPSIPTQPGPDQSAAPTCCGRAMRRDGTQWVCGKCKGWHDTGRAALTLVPAVVEEVTV
ncbi:hypothetical protein J7E96_28365 [Streptomyces sp. ISL-96]|uniref:hypothetical protein n=1 Tax=Streptomyces sp. ISL-96 TaxID=2819191 RepID=UPI001BE8658D|nr:hypothetical protein [Streptomyces sp. ISL-96]MBT2492355.1 hypothetical protein [Streptomyces sp. ISL-96]